LGTHRSLVGSSKRRATRGEADKGERSTVEGLENEGVSTGDGPIVSSLQKGVVLGGFGSRRRSESRPHARSPAKTDF